MLFFLCIAQDGWARTDGWTFPRHAICASRDGKAPAFRWRNGGPRALTKPSASKEVPQWMRRAQAYVHAQGGLPLEACEAAVQWFRAHRTGFPMTSDLSTLAAK